MIHTVKSQKEQLDSFEQLCKEAGLKITHQRVVIFRELVLTPDHPTAETLHQRIRKEIPSISLDTVYRTLATFEKCGIVRKVDTNESLSHFEAGGVSHHHVICSQCKDILDFSWDAVDGEELPSVLKEWGAVQERNLTVYGICNNCLQKAQTQ